MWPQTLQMSEDDCRSTLRRLELETYSNVVGVFRAQGGLTDRKTKLLEELRSVFHISQDRHRAEARRVVNDELLSTISKAVSGPNTWQEWAREGRRTYPMLPRVAPQTALGWIANKLANEAAIENAKLPLPAETAAAAAEEQAAILAANAAAEAAGLCYTDRYLVTSDPFKTPDIPAAGIKKNLKRGMNDGHQLPGSGSSKKRNINDSPSTNKHKHITGTTNTPSTNNNRKNAALSRVQQQRFFYQQQQKAKKLAKAAATKREKLPGASKCGRKSKKFKEQLREEQEYQRQQQELLLQQQHQHQQHDEDYADNAYENYSSTNTSSNIVVSDSNLIHTHEQQICGEDSKHGSNQKSIYLPLIMPQIAASKRDITRNLTKLQIPGTSPTAQISNQFVAGHSAPSIGSPISGVTKGIVDSKLTPLSTPVQKYIVEDRQPPATTPHAQTSNAVVGGATTTPTSTPQFISMPHLPVSSKLRPINPTILPPGTKLSTTTKKLGGTTILSATLLSPGGSATSPLSENLMSNANASAHLYNSMEGSSTAVPSGSNQGNISILGSQQPSPMPPTHTPPAVIQLHGNEVVRGSTQPQQQQSIAASTTPSQSKVLTTKILPIVFGNSPSSSSNAIKNGGGVGAAGTATTNFVSNSSGATIIKSLPSSVLVSGQQSSNLIPSGSTSFSAFGNSGQVYRKHPNILKSTSSLRSSSNNSGGPQIISNIRLTPAITTTNTTNPTQSTNIFQQQLRISPASAGIRTSVKICQSPNGKVFIQPANVDPSKITSGHLAQRIVPSNLLGNSSSPSSSSTNVPVGGNTVANQPGSAHRIAIKKVQIIPAPLPSNTTASQNLQQRLGTTTLSLGGNKTNIFMPSTSTLRPTKSVGSLTLTKGAFMGAAASGLNDSSGGGGGYSKHTTDVIKSSNVVVIDSTNKLNSQNPNLSTSNLNLNRSINSSHMITEDTPVDIIVDGSSDMTTTALTSTNETSSITAVLASNLIENHTQPQLLTPEKQSASTVVPITVLSATDWEMELDQATAASSMQQQQQQQQQQPSGTIDVSNLKLHEQSESDYETAERIITDDSFEDVIIEEEEDEEGEVDGELEGNEEEENEENASELDMDIVADNDIIMVDDVESVKVANKHAHTNHESGIGIGMDEVQKTIEIDEDATEITDIINTAQPYTISQDNNTKNNINVQERGKNNEDYKSAKQEIVNINDNDEVDDIQKSTMHNNHDDVDNEEEARISPVPAIQSENPPANDTNSIDESDIEETSEAAFSTTTTPTVTAIATTVSGAVVSVQGLDERKINSVKNDEPNELDTTLNISDGTNCSTRDELHTQTDH